MTNDEGMTKLQHAPEDDGSFWLDDATPLVREEPNTKPVYDLEEQTARFGEAVIGKLWIEARELHLIFSKIWRTGKNA